MHDHLDKRDGGDADMFEMIRIASPWPLVVDFLHFIRVVNVEGIAGRVNELDGVLDLYVLISTVRLLRKCMRSGAHPSPSEPCLRNRGAAEGYDERIICASISLTQL